MALFLAESVINPLPYATPSDEPPGVWDIYNQDLLIPPRIYRESLSAITSFFYVPPPTDRLILWGYTRQTAWPSWGVYAFHFRASTGEYIERIEGGLFGMHYTRSIEWGDLNHTYVCRNETTDCFQMNWQTYASERAAWEIHPYSWTTKRIFSHILVNKQDDRILAVQYPYIEIWTDVTRGTPTLSWSMRIGYPVRDLAYESNKYGWVLLDDGQILKINWGDYQRIEMASSIQGPSTDDLGYLLAYDSYRKRLVVFRWLEDAVNGAAQNRLEFYETVPKPMYLTEPVPVSRHLAGDFVKFKANIIGDKGEGFSGGLGAITLIAPNNHGTVLSKSIVSGIAGDFNISYQAPATACTETIQIQVEHDDDITL